MGSWEDGPLSPNRASLLPLLLSCFRLLSFFLLKQHSGLPLHSLLILCLRLAEPRFPIALEIPECVPPAGAATQKGAFSTGLTSGHLTTPTGAPREERPPQADAQRAVISFDFSKCTN